MARCPGSTRVYPMVDGLCEPAQLDTMPVKDLAAIEFVCVFSQQGIEIGRASRTDCVFVDSGLPSVLIMGPLCTMRQKQ